MAENKKITPLTVILKGVFGIIFILLFNFLLAGRWDY